MFHSTLLCSQPTGTSNAETLHSGIRAPPIARNASTQTLVQICIVSAFQPTWSSLASEPSLQSTSNSRWSLPLMSSSFSVQHRVQHGRHQRTHPPQFATRRASPLSNVVAHRWQTTVATRLNRVKMTNKKKTNSINAEGKCLPCVCSVSCATLCA